MKAVWSEVMSDGYSDQVLARRYWDVRRQWILHADRFWGYVQRHPSISSVERSAQEQSVLVCHQNMLQSDSDVIGLSHSPPTPAKSTLLVFSFPLCLSCWHQILSQGCREIRLIKAGDSQFMLLESLCKISHFNLFHNDSLSLRFQREDFVHN